MTPELVAGIVDYGMGNLASVSRALQQVGFRTVVSDDKTMVKDADLVVLPGVGNFTAGMKNLDRLGLVDALKARGEAGRPMLGICLGMQLFFEWSEEGETKGLGSMPGKVTRLSGSEKVPHMGWNTIESRSELFEPFDGSYFYYVHSYVCEPAEATVAAVSVYGREWAAAVSFEGALGVQFHPERSSRDGLSLLSRMREVMF